jgi:PAT family beta-lactamase induction signal transducer AmpG
MALGLPNLLETRRGRLIAFFCLYATEGIPLGFAAVAVAQQLRREGVGAAEIGAFIALFYLPWAFKWAAGPIVDVFAWERVGRRRGWILLTQIVMAITLLSTVALRLPEQLWLFSAILFVHNIFSATQDVAIDALACSTLAPEERGTANGVMFAGAYAGNALGGGGVLMLTSVIPFQATFFVVSGAILLVTIFVVLPMREAPGPKRERSGSPLRAAAGEMRTFAIDAFRSFLGTRGAFAGVFFSLLPAGAMAISLILTTTLAVELGMSEASIGSLAVASTVVSGVFCVLGGWLSDRLGRRTTLFVYIALMGLPTLALMIVLLRAGIILPPQAVEGAAVATYTDVPPYVLVAFVAASMVYAAFQGLMYGTRSAIMMDVTNPIVAGTQFTAYMALANLAISYSAAWQGEAIKALGYPTTLALDVAIGSLCLLLIPLIAPSKRDGVVVHGPDGRSAGRAKLLSFALALGCAAFGAKRLFVGSLGGAEGIVDTFFTLAFVASAVVLLCGIAFRGGRTAAPRAVVWPVVGGLVVLAVRGWIDPLVERSWPSFSDAWRFVEIGLASASAALLVAYGLHRWKELDADADVPAGEDVAPDVWAGR